MIISIIIIIIMVTIIIVTITMVKTLTKTMKSITNIKLLGEIWKPDNYFADKNHVIKLMEEKGGIE